MKQNLPRHQCRIHREEFRLIHIRNPHSRYSGLVRLGWLLPRMEEYLVMEQLGQATAAQLLWSQIRMNAVRDAVPAMRVNWYTTNGVAELRRLVGEAIHLRISGELAHRRNHQVEVLRSGLGRRDRGFSCYQGHQGRKRTLVMTHQIEFTERWPKIAREIHRAVEAVVARENGQFANLDEPSPEPRVARIWERIRARLDRG